MGFERRVIASLYTHRHGESGSILPHRAALRTCLQLHTRCYLDYELSVCDSFRHVHMGSAVSYCVDEEKSQLTMS